MASFGQLQRSQMEGIYVFKNRKKDCKGEKGKPTKASRKHLLHALALANMQPLIEAVLPIAVITIFLPVLLSVLIICFSATLLLLVFFVWGSGRSCLVVFLGVIIVIVYRALEEVEKGAGRGRRMESSRWSIEGYDGAVGAAGAFAEGCCWGWGLAEARSVGGTKMRTGCRESDERGEEKEKTKDGRHCSLRCLE